MPGHRHVAFCVALGVCVLATGALGVSEKNSYLHSEYPAVRRETDEVLSAMKYARIAQNLPLLADEGVDQGTPSQVAPLSFTRTWLFHGGTKHQECAVVLF